MALLRWSPFQDLFDVRRDMDRLMDRMFGSATRWPNGTTERVWAPAVDVFMREGDLVVRAQLPGVDPERDVEISLQDGVLIVRGERKWEEKVEEEGLYRLESSYGSFQRSIPLPQGVTEEHISANYDRGVLEVVVSGVRELTGGKRIPVQTGQKAITVGGEQTS